MTLVARSPDLARLVDEGYDIEIRDAFLLVHHVPYVTSAGKVDHCILVSELTTNGAHTIEPQNHTVWVVGDVPHDHQGNKVTIVINDEQPLNVLDGLTASCQMSGKPSGKLPTDYHHKMANYVTILGTYARRVEVTATHTNFPQRPTADTDSVFLYLDSASSRSMLGAVTSKLADDRLGIVGLGGTGSHVLDLVAKTPAAEIHLFDDDEFVAHNAFRAPGAAHIDDLAPRPKKVDYFAGIYGRMRRNVVPHATRIDSETVAALDAMTFVFLAMDASPDKKVIIDRLRERGLPFIDCGMGLRRVNDSLTGTVRATAGMPGAYDHIERRVSFGDVTADEYDFNLQTADLNMLNAVMAVVKWKKIRGYYVDTTGELNSTYNVRLNTLNSAEVHG
jgi:hypothetical protein